MALALIHAETSALVLIQAPSVPAEVLTYLWELAGQSSHSQTPIRDRFAAITLSDTSDRRLAEKVLDCPKLISRLRQIIEIARNREVEVGGLIGYASSDRMQKIADLLDIPLLETPVRTLVYGTKAGARRVFRDAAVSHPRGTYEPVYNPNQLAADLTRSTAAHGVTHWIIKIDAGLGSGHGNATIQLPDGGRLSSVSDIVGLLTPTTRSVSLDDYFRLVRRYGAVIEEDLTAAGNSPLTFSSAVGHIGEAPQGSTVLAVHNQDIDLNHQYVSCSFPSDERFRRTVQDATNKVLDVLRRQGACGYVGVDFAHDVTANATFALEVNLRQTGSLHPHMTVRSIVPGTWTSDGRFLSSEGIETFYLGTDGIIDDKYRGWRIAGSPSIRGGGVSENSTKGRDTTLMDYPSAVRKDRCNRHR